MINSNKDHKKKIFTPFRIVFTLIIAAAVLTVFVGVWRHKKNNKDIDNTTVNTNQTVYEENKTVSDTDAATDGTVASSTEGTTVTTETSSDVSTTLGETDPLKFSTEQILNYLNTAGNKVRTQKPGFTYIEKSSASGLKVKDLKAKLLINVAEKIIGHFLKDYEINVEKGSKNAPIEDYALTTYFGSEQADWALALKPSDVKSAKITKEGNNYRVNVTLIDEMNPKKNGQSAFSRGMLILTIQDILKIAYDECDDLLGGKMSIEMENEDSAKLYYHDGHISALIDPKGNIIQMDSKMLIDVTGKNFTMKIGNVKAPLFTYKCEQFDVTIGKEYTQKNFKW